MSSTKKTNEPKHPEELRAQVKAELQNGFISTVRELSHEPIHVATEFETQTRKNMDVKNFDMKDKKGNNNRSVTQSHLSEVNTAMEMDQWARSDLKTSIPGTQLTVMDRTFEGNGVSQWSMGMNDHDHRRSDSVSLCSYHSGNERCCGYPNCLELIMERASWKPEKLRIFHCNDCGGTTIQEIRSLYIDGRLRRSYSMDRMQHDWHCSHCGFWNSNSDTVSIYKTTNLLNAKHFNSSSRTISRTSMLTSLTDLCKHPTPSASYHSQKHNKFSIRSNSIQCKHNKKCNEKFGQYMRSGGCNHAVINESQMGSSLMQKSKVEIEAVKWTATQEASIVKSTSTATAMESLKASPTRKNLLRSISAEESKGFQTVVARETEPKMKLLRTAKWTIDSTQSTTCKDDTESTLNEQMGNEKSLNSAVPLTPTTEVIVDQHNRGYDVGTGRSLPIDLLETALELNCEVIESSKKTRKTAKQISETDLKTAIEKTTTLLGDVNGCPTKYNDRYMIANIVSKSSEEKILGDISAHFNLTKLNDTIHNSSINRNDISTTKSTFNSIDNLSSTTGQILNSNFSTVGLKAVGSDERKFDILAVTVTPPRRHVVLQSTADCSVRLTPSSYHYRTPTRTDPKTASPQTPSYMAPTISSAMKTKKMAERCTSLESPLWTSRRGHSISEELRTAVSFTPSRKREGHRSRLTLWQQETSQTLPKLYYKERFVNSCPEAKSLTTECGIANELNNENLRRASSQPLFRVARSSLRHGGLYNNYLKQLYWDRITSKYNKISQKESFMKGKDQGAEDFASIDGQNAQMEISLHVKQTELQLSPRNSYREETFRFHLDRDHLSRQDQIDNDILTPNLCTAQVKTPRGWQRTFSRAPSKVSRFDRFASQFVETVSTQVWMTKTSLGQFPPYTLAETARYNIWQCVFGNSSQKISRFNRFQKGPETKDTKFTFQPAQYISQLEQFTNEFILTESKMLRGLIWKRTVSKASPKTSRFDRFLVPDNSVTNITQGNTRSEQFESEVPLDSAAIQSLLSNTPRSPETVPIPRQSTVFYEQAKLIPLPEVSCKSNSSSLHNTQLRSLNASLTESLSSEKLSEKHSNFTIKSLCEVTSSECFKKNIASSSRTSETQSSEGSVLSDVIFHGESFCKRSKSTLQRTSRSDCFQKTLSTSSIASTKSFEALTISKSLFSRVSTRKQSKTSRLLRRTSRFERFQKNTISILSTARANSLSPSILLDISSSEGTLSERSKSTPSLQFPRQTCISPSKHSTSPCIWNLLMAKPKEKSSRIERFQNSASLDLRTARNQLSNSSLFYDISLIPSSGRCSQTKVIPSIQEKITTNTFNSWQKEKMSDKSSRFERFESSLLPNTHTAQSTCSQNLSTKRFLKKQTEQEESYKISYKKHFKTDHFTSEKIIEASGAKCCHRDDHSLCSDSSVYSLLTARQRSAEQSVTCHSPDSIDLCKNECPADSTAQTIIKSGPDQKLEQRTSYRERLDNPASISSKINVFNEIKGGKSSELWNRSIVQQTILDRKEEQYFDVRTLSAEKKLTQLMVDNKTSTTKDIDVQTGMVKGTGSYTVSILLHGTNSESMAPGDIVSSYREIHIELQTKFQPMKLCLNGITTSEEVCVQRVVVNGSEVYHR